MNKVRKTIDAPSCLILNYRLLQVFAAGANDV
jgi:hypothetical protein